MNSVDIIIYSYKGKHLKDVLNSIFTNISKESKVNVFLLDQNPLDRKNNLQNQFNIEYSHISWDSIVSPCFYKSTFINNAKSDYTMILGDTCFLNKDWDIQFINFIKNNNIILSDNRKTKLYQKNNFYIAKEQKEISNFELNNFISRNFIFAKTENIKKIIYPNYLKYNGEEEVLSLQFFAEGIDIYSVPTNIVHYSDDQPINHVYTPFSLNHNYNEALQLLKFGHNRYINLKNKSRNILDFKKYHNFDFNNIDFLPFFTDDVAYDPDQLNFNQVDARKFVARTKAIH